MAEIDKAEIDRIVAALLTAAALEGGRSVGVALQYYRAILDHLRNPSDGEAEPTV